MTERLLSYTKRPSLWALEAMMQEMGLVPLIAAVRDPSQEGVLYEQVQILCDRQRDPLARLKREELLERSHTALTAILKAVLRHQDPFVGEPGHGPGHWCRDYIHALRLAHDPELKTSLILPCILAGTLHDVGTLFLDRYQDGKRVVRHAEAGALIVHAAALETGALTQAEADVVAYAIVAHTHYLRETEVQCADGVKRMVRPYRDVDGGNAPVLETWLSRWADRLDCSGPCMIGRHYLTLAHDHDDYSQEGFYKVTFAEHLRPLLRSKEAIAAAGGKQTMLEHMRMFASSQTNESPYGKHDHGHMVHMRDTYRAQLEHIVSQVARPTDIDDARMLQVWTRFLSANIEPSIHGKEAAHDLARNFVRLDEDTRRAWACGFRATMAEYLPWADRNLRFLDRLPAKYLRIPGVFPDVRDIIRPSLDWLGPFIA